MGFLIFSILRGTILFKFIHIKQTFPFFFRLLIFWNLKKNKTLIYNLFYFSFFFFYLFIYFFIHSLYFHSHLPTFYFLFFTLSPYKIIHCLYLPSSINVYFYPFISWTISLIFYMHIIHSFNLYSLFSLIFSSIYSIFKTNSS